MRNAPVIDIKVTLMERIRNLAGEYGKLDKEFLIESTQRIGKRLGPEQTRDAIMAIRENRMEDFIRLVLVYYDKTYQSGLTKRNKENVFPLELESADIAAKTKRILDFTGMLPV